MDGMLKMLAFDFGASSGRAILGRFDGHRLEVEEIHRFANEPVDVLGNLHWDILRLFHEIKEGIRKCGALVNRDIASISVDTWGVDFGLLDREGALVGNPFHYRDSRTEGMMEEVFRIIPPHELYSRTGIQFMKLNTLFQLYSMKAHGSSQLERADALLLTPDLFHYFLTGIKKSEYSIASTTQMLDAATGDWAYDLIDRLGLPGRILCDIVSSGTVIGQLSKSLAEDLRVDQAAVVAGAGHDTQAAIAAVPAMDPDFVFISSGTWSLMGVETDHPVINEKSDRYNFTNEGGVEGRTSFLKNIMGLWLVQECKRQWDREGRNLGFAQMEGLAGAAEPFRSYIDPNDDTFAAPGNMPERIREYCRRTGQPVPESDGEVIRCIYQSLAYKYRETVEQLEDVLGKALPVIHMVGGGIKDRMLCQITSDATGRKVIAGPVEATAIGNLMVQAKALGKVSNLEEIRKVVRASFPTETFQPRDVEQWNMEYEKYRRIHPEKGVVRE